MPVECTGCGTVFGTPIQLRSHKMGCAGTVAVPPCAVQLALSQHHKQTSNGDSCVTPDLGAVDCDATAAGLMRASHRFGMGMNQKFDIQEKMRQLRSQGDQAAAAVLPMIALIRWTNDEALIGRLRRTHAAAIASGHDVPTARAQMSAETALVAAEMFEPARRLASSGGLADLVATGVFDSMGLQLHEVLQQLDQAQDLLGTRLHKQALREVIAKDRKALMRPSHMLRTVIAAKMFKQHGDRCIGYKRMIHQHCLMIIALTAHALMTAVCSAGSRLKCDAMGSVSLTVCWTKKNALLCMHTSPSS